MRKSNIQIGQVYNIKPGYSGASRVVVRSFVSTANRVNCTHFNDLGKKRYSNFFMSTTLLETEYSLDLALTLELLNANTTTI